MHIDAKTVGRIALIAGVGLGAVALLAACAPREQEPSDAAIDRFSRFNANGDGGISTQEVYRLSNNGTIYGVRELVGFDGRYNHYRQRIGFEQVTRSMAAAHQAADTNRDAIASWAELTALAASFSTDGTPTLSRSEQRAFDNAYGPRIVGRENVWTGYREWTVDTYPNVPYDPPSGPGDSGTVPGPVDPPTGPGDSDPIPVPSDPPTGPGDGNSSDNGNPDPDDL